MGQTRKLLIPSDRELVELLSAGKTTDQIQAAWRVTTNRLCKVARAHGIQRRGGERFSHPRAPLFSEAVFHAALHSNDGDLTRTSHALGLSWNTVNRYIGIYGWPEGLDRARQGRKLKVASTAMGAAMAKAREERTGTRRERLAAVFWYASARMVLAGEGPAAEWWRSIVHRIEDAFVLANRKAIVDELATMQATTFIDRTTCSDLSSDEGNGFGRVRRQNRRSAYPLHSIAVETFTEESTSHGWIDPDVAFVKR